MKLSALGHTGRVSFLPLVGATPDRE